MKLKNRQKFSVFEILTSEVFFQTPETVKIVFNGQKMHVEKDVFHDFMVSTIKSPIQPLL